MGGHHGRGRITVSRLAGVAQLVEQSIRNRQVIGSSPIVGSTIGSPLGERLKFRSDRRLPFNSRPIAIWPVGSESLSRSSSNAIIGSG